MNMVVVKMSEKLILWLHRTKKTQQWLATELDISRQAVGQKISTNMFTDSDIVKLRALGFIY